MRRDKAAIAVGAGQQRDILLPLRHVFLRECQKRVDGRMREMLLYLSQVLRDEAGMSSHRSKI